MFSYFNRSFLVLACFIFAAAFLYKNMGGFKNVVPPLNEAGTQLGSHNVNKSATVIHSDEMSTYLNQSTAKILNVFGKPSRKDPTPFGYEWWIYGEGSESYLQIGIANNRVVTIYALGKNLKTAPFAIGSSLPHSIKVSQTPTIQAKDVQVTFELQQDDLDTRPLVQVGSNWAELYIDQFTGKLTSIRYVTPQVLIEQRPFNMEYQGVLPKAPSLTSKDWEDIDRAEEKEIWAISNVLRVRYKVQTLKWSPQAEKAAYLHSQEMDIKNYFSHDSKWQGNLTDRLKKQNINFQLAGENIAAHYEDGISATIGWLNSEEHRKNLLHPDFTELGPGVYHDYYTQDFVRPF
ncbi:CAP domain-containing protein [Pullulanibacillus sp. KACC 23026]|uniref:CAP domain-containing protein n=1 Tax=Pullulanibacillus sp. KACC 23026 TaxID=3028315 RepID=UPI0023B059C7|nr:CAP domain-containing protein [Pullulanibacillus sp. KACC 23026]WEG11692.1 CAP domain-containing protein [Pullulanibacillus sp. KACC 23026]